MTPFVGAQVATGIGQNIAHAAFAPVVEAHRAPPPDAVRRWRRVYGPKIPPPADVHRLPAWILGAALLAGGTLATWALLELGFIKKPSEGKKVKPDDLFTLGTLLLNPVSLAAAVGEAAARKKE